jgi:hypothetical protein
VRSLADVSTVKQIQDFGKLVDKIYNLAAQTSGTTPAADNQLTVIELQSLLGAGVQNTFTSSTTNNNALAFKINQAIVDADPATMLTGQGVKLDNGTKVNYYQTQLERLQALVSLEVIKNYVVDTVTTTNTTAEPQVSDWRAAGIFKPMDEANKFELINSSHLTYLNSAANALVPTAVDSTVKLQAVADAYFKIIKEANGSAVDADTSSNPVKADFVAVGAIESTLNDNDANLLASLVGEKSESQVNTITLIKDLLPTIHSVMTLAGKANTANVIDAITTNDVEAADVTALSVTKLTSDLNLQGVNDKNHKDILAAIQNKEVAEVDTFAHLQSLVSLTRIQRYADNSDVSNASSDNYGGTLPTSSTSSPDDWKNLIGVNDEDSLNYNAYNSAVDALNRTDIAVITDLSDLVTSYNKIIKEANGSSTSDATAEDPTKTDYDNIGLKLSDLWSGYGTFSPASPVTTPGTKADAALNLFNDSVGSLASGAVDSITDLSSLAGFVKKVIDLSEVTATSGANANTSIGLAASDLKALGLDTTLMETNFVGATLAANRFAHVRDAIYNSTYVGVDSFAELQQMIQNSTVITA